MLTLTSSDLAPSRLAAEAIRLYQRYISPRKGFRCAHRALHGRRSCSEFARRAVLRKGLVKMLAILRQRFAACATSAKKLHYERKQRRKSRQIDWTRDGVDCATEACVNGGSAGCDVDPCVTGVDVPCGCDL